MENEPLYLSATRMAKLIGRSKDYLKERKSTVFKEGVHYFTPEGETQPFWKVAAMVDWVEKKDPSNNPIANKILDKIAG